MKKLKLFNGEALTNENNAAEANKGKDKDEKKLKLDNGKALKAEDNAEAPCTICTLLVLTVGM